ALSERAEGIQVSGRGWLLKELYTGLGENWEEAQGSQAVPAGVDVAAKGDAAIEGIDKLCDAGNVCCWLARAHLELERLMPMRSDTLFDLSHGLLKRQYAEGPGAVEAIAELAAVTVSAGDMKG